MNHAAATDLLAALKDIRIRASGAANAALFPSERADALRALAAIADAAIARATVLKQT